MASKFGLTASEITSVISQLESDNSEFKSRVTELESEQQTLASQWTGDANTVFNTYFQQNKATWDTFAATVEQYISTLQSILQAYEQAEATNAETAKTT